MRALFNDHYKKGRGFTTEEMIGHINRITKKDYHDFYRKYVFGTDVPDYDRIFGYAGYTLKKETQQIPDLGFFRRFRSGGFAVNGVQPNSGAARAGLRAGDIITKINGQSATGFPIQTLAGKTATFTVSRNGADVELPVAIGARDVMNWSFVSVPAPTAAQMNIRNGWLKR